MPGITHRTFVSYIDRTRDYYAAQGYERPYVWARNTEAPFTPLAKPLARSRVTVITTASPWRDDKPVEGVLRGGKQVWSGETATPPARLYTDDLAWDKEATHTRDVESFLPLARLAELVAAGRIGSLAARFHGVPTDYSQRRTLEQDAPEILARCHEDAADVALLVPL
jgi:D-proline reductase (dithiol) PrdB